MKSKEEQKYLEMEDLEDLKIHIGLAIGKVNILSKKLNRDNEYEKRIHLLIQKELIELLQHIEQLIGPDVTNQ